MKLRNYLLAIMLVMVAPMCLVACGEENPNTYVGVGWIEVAQEDTTIAMAINSGSTYKLNYTVVPASATDPRVTFESDDESIARVDEDGVITAVGVGSTSITVQSVDNSNAFVRITVNVLANKQQLATPAGFTYDSARRELSWQPVAVEGSSFVPQYRLNLNIDGVESTRVVPNTTFTDIIEGSLYSVSLQAVGNDSMYDDSAPTETITFAQLASPEELGIVSSLGEEDETRKYSVRFKLANFAPSAENYEIEFNATNGIFSAEDRALLENAASPENIRIEGEYAYIDIPEGLSRTTYSVRVRAISSDARYYTSNYCDAIRFARLSSPENLSLVYVGDTQQLSWSTVLNASQYRIQVDYHMNDGSDQTYFVNVSVGSGSSTVYDFSNLTDKPADNTYTGFDVYVFAIGSDSYISGVRYLDSDISDLPAMQQLRPVENVVAGLTENGQEYNITWNEVQNANTYAIYIGTDGSSQITASDNFVGNTSSTKIPISINSGYWTVGNNYIKIVAQPTDTGSGNYIASTPTVYGTFIKLATPSNFHVSNGVLVWEGVQNANQYEITFTGSGSSTKPTVDAIPGMDNYEYAPTTADMSQVAENYLVSIRAIDNTDNYMIIDSNETDVIDISRFATPANLRVVDGELVWDSNDEFGDAIGTDMYEVRIESLEGEELAVFQASSGVSVENQLQNLEASDRYFVFKVRAINIYDNRNFINGDWTEGISTYQLETPSNVRVENGVITWDAFSDMNVEAGHTGIRYVLRIGSQEYGQNSDPILTINSTSAIISGLTAGSLNYTVQLQATIVASESGDFGVTTKGNDTIFIINSNFSEPFSVRQLSSPTGVTIIDGVLYWSPSNTSLNNYRVELYRINETNGIRSRGECVWTGELQPNDPASPSFNFALQWGLDEDATASVSDSTVLSEGAIPNIAYGAYEFVVYAIGTNHNITSSANYGYLTSYESASVEIYKLETPVLDIVDGEIRWGYVYDNLGGTSRQVRNYIIRVARNTADGQDIFEFVVDTGFTTTLNDLPSRFYNDQLFVSIQAVSVWERVYDSEMSAPYTRPSDANPETGVFVVRKLPAPEVDPVHVSIDGRTITWTDNDNDEQSFIIQVYENSALTGEILRTTAIVQDHEYTLPDYGSGNYYIVIRRQGYTLEDPSAPTDPNRQRGTQYISSDFSDKLYIERLVRPTGLVMTRGGDSGDDPILSWTATGAGDYMKFKIEISYVLNGTETIATYYMPYNQTSLNLFGKAYDEDGTEVDVIDFPAGAIRITVQSVIAGEGTVTNDSANTVYLMEGPRSANYAAYVYAAPNVTFTDGILYFNKTNQYDKGLQLEFVPLTLQSEADAEQNTPVTYSISDTDSIRVSLNPNVNTYSMSTGFEVNQKYLLRIRALGNSSYLITSEWENSLYILERLAPLEANSINMGIENESLYDGWYVKDGVIYWNAVQGVAEYEATLAATDGSGAVYNAFTLDADTSTQQYSSPVTGINYGSYNLQFRLIGGGTNTPAAIVDDSTEYLLGYVTSDFSTPQLVTKLYAPNDSSVNGRTDAFSRIVDGEFDWGIRDGMDQWIDESGATAYLLDIADYDSFTFPLTNPTAHFTASEVFQQSAGRYDVSLYSIGNTWTGTNDEGAIYLTSDSTGVFTIIYGGQISDLNVTSGQLNWSEVNNGSRSGYDIEYIYSGSDEQPNYRRLNTNIYSFDDLPEAKGRNFNSIRVRYAGEDATTSGAYEGYVNCMWSTEMVNITKLPDIALTEMDSGTSRYLYINDYGQLEWNYGANYGEGTFTDFDINMHLYLDITYLGTSVGGYATGWDLARTVNSFDVPVITISDEDRDNALLEDNNPLIGTAGIMRYNMYGYVAGTRDTTTDTSATGEVIYLNSNTYECGAYKLNAPNMFQLDQINGPGLRLNWDISSSSLSGYEPLVEQGQSAFITVPGDTILFSYSVNGDPTTKYHRLVNVEEISNIPLWELAYYDNISLKVLNSNGAAFGSSTLTLQQISFQYFTGGSGAPEDPFVIADNTSVSSQYTAEYLLELVYWLPEMYFRLDQDVTLTDLSIKSNGDLSMTSNYPIPAGITGTGVDESYGELIFSGGFDGDGHSIKNVQVNNANYYGWWQMIIGGDLPEDTPENNFENRRGIIKDLTIVADSINVSALNYNSFNGLFVQQNYGWIIGCTADGTPSSDREDEGEYVPVIQGAIRQNTVYIGGIAGLVGRYDFTQVTEEYEDYDGIGRIENCTNLLDLSIMPENDQNYSSYVGGIAGRNFAGYIIGCQNGVADSTLLSNRATIHGFYVGGIAGYTSGNTITVDTEEVNQYSYISGCVNYGNVSTRYATSGSDIVASSAGGIAGYSSLTYITYCMNLGTISTDGLSAHLGGIAGTQETGGYTLSCVGIGDITYNRYYVAATGEYTLATNYIYTGAIIGNATSGNMVAVWYLNNNIVELDNQNGNTPSRTTASHRDNGVWESIYIGTDDFTNGAEITPFLTNNDTKINRVTVQAAEQTVDCIVLRYDGLVAQFNLILGQNPTLVWVDPNSLDGYIPPSTEEPTE